MLFKLPCMNQDMHNNPQSEPIIYSFNAVFCTSQHRNQKLLPKPGNCSKIMNSKSRIGQGKSTQLWVLYKKGDLYKEKLLCFGKIHNNYINTGVHCLYSSLISLQVLNYRAKRRTVILLRLRTGEVGERKAWVRYLQRKNRDVES